MPVSSPDLVSILVTVVGAVVGNAVVLAILGFLGKGLFNAALNRDLERFKAELKGQGDLALERVRQEASKEIESYKIKLKKSEFLFQQQFLAANGMIKLFANFSPQKRNPTMDWSDACEEMIANASQTEQSLREFMVQHGAALDEVDRSNLRRATSLANDLYMDDFSGTPSTAASHLHELISDLQDKLITKIQLQSSI